MDIAKRPLYIQGAYNPGMARNGLAYRYSASMPINLIHFHPKVVID